MIIAASIESKPAKAVRAGKGKAGPPPSGADGGPVPSSVPDRPDQRVNRDGRDPAERAPVARGPRRAGLRRQAIRLGCLSCLAACLREHAGIGRGGAVTVVAGQIETIGVWRVISGSGTFLLRNSNSTGPADITTFGGASGYYPVVGDWDGDG